MAHLLQAFIKMLGGVAIWLLSNFMNVVFSKNYKSNIGYYLYEDIQYEMHPDYSSKNVNFVTGIFVFVLIITIIGFYN